MNSVQYAKKNPKNHQLIQAIPISEKILITNYQRIFIKRAKLDNLKYLSGSNRLRNIDEKYFIENKLSWHKDCYKALTHKSDISRYETNFQRGGAVKK